MVGIVDYGMGNLLSVYSAFDYLGVPVSICHHPDELEKVDRIIIPGVGAFKDCITRIKETGFKEALELNVLKRAKPTLGICLGMQVMATKGLEGGENLGLGWFESTVVRLTPNPATLRVPNIGWNDIQFDASIPLFRGLSTNADFYLVHSYFMQFDNPKNNIVATYEYGQKVTAAVLRDNIFATQFHPEKSQDHGLRLLENFITWKP